MDPEEVNGEEGHVEGGFGTSEKVVVKFLIPNSAAGSVIGKGGATIAEFQHSSEAKILLSRTREQRGYDDYGPPGGADRILQISGSLLQVITALQLILKKLEEEGLQQTPNDAEEGTFLLKILAPSKLCGAVIGKEGHTIQSFKEDSKCDIRVQSVEAMTPGSTERVITTIGTLPNVLRAVGLIVHRMSEDPTYSEYYAATQQRNPTHYGAAPVYQGHVRDSPFARLQTYLTVGIPDEDVGAILGKAGRNIVEIQQQAGVRIKVSDRDDIMPGTPNCRKVTIQGAFDAVMHAQQIMGAYVEQGGRGGPRGRGRARGRGRGSSRGAYMEDQDMD